MNDLTKNQNTNEVAITLKDLIDIIKVRHDKAMRVDIIPKVPKIIK